jgi:hypothetical protein
MKLVRSVVLVTAAAAVALMPTAAHADKYVHTDVSGDVVTFDPESDTTAVDPERTEGDIVRSVVRHRAHKVVLTLAYRELSSSTPMLHYFAIRTSTAKRYVSLRTSASHPGGRVAMFDGHDKKVRCHVRRKIDYTANTATVAVPRSCLSNPRWVKVAMAQATFGTASGPFYIDDSRATGNFNNPQFGPRVHR